MSSCHEHEIDKFWIGAQLSWASNSSSHAHCVECILLHSNPIHLQNRWKHNKMVAVPTTYTFAQQSCGNSSNFKTTNLAKGCFIWLRREATNHEWRPITKLHNYSGHVISELLGVGWSVDVLPWDSRWKEGDYLEVGSHSSPLTQTANKMALWLAFFPWIQVRDILHYLHMA